jgi:prepilin peptidase CpaA
MFAALETAGAAGAAAVGATPLILINAVLLAALGHAVWTDIRWRRISNRVTYPAILAGLALNLIAAGLHGVLLSSVGFLVAGVLLLLPVLLRGVGAGDLKLFAAIGALKGPGFAVHTLIGAGLAGGVLVALYAVLSIARQRGRPKTIPYAPALAAGALYALVTSLA